MCEFLVPGVFWVFWHLCLFLSLFDAILLGDVIPWKTQKLPKELLNMHSIYIYIYMCIHICKNIESERFILLLVFVRGTACQSVKIYRKMAEPEIALSGSSIFIQMGNQVLPFYIYRKIAEARRGLLLIAFVPERACLSAYSTCTIHIYTYMYICIYIYI